MTNDGVDLGPTTGRDAGERLAPRVDLRDPTEAELARRVAVAWRELRRGAAGATLRDHFLGSGPDGIEQGPMDTLDVLMARREWRMSELADALRVDPSTATRAVQRLERQGLAERRTCGDDGRVVIVRASRAGVRRHRTVSKRRAAAMGRLLGAFDADERRQLADLLERFVHEVDALVAELDAPDQPAEDALDASAAEGPADDAPSADNGTRPDDSSGVDVTR